MAADDTPPRRGLIRRTVGGAGRMLKFAYLGDTSEIRNNHQFFKQRLHRVLHPGESANNETFEQACERLGVTDADVARRASELHRSVLLYRIVAVIALAVFCLMPWVSHPINHAVMCTLVLTMALVKLSVVRWRQGQCEHRTLMGYLAFWRQLWSKS